MIAHSLYIQKKTFFTIFITLWSLPFMLTASEVYSGREYLNMNTHWAFHRGDLAQAETIGYDDQDWEEVSIPHVMRIERKHNGGGGVYQGIGWYRRYFHLSGNYRKKRITLHFEGVQMNCEIFLNGAKIAEHSGGYLGFVVDITTKVKFGSDNVLVVKVTNNDDPHTPPGKPMKKLDFNYYGGIYRDVKMLVTDKIYISDPLEANKVAGGGVLVSYPEVSSESASINCHTHIVNGKENTTALRLETSLLDSDGKVVSRTVSNGKLKHNGDSTFSQDLTVTRPKLWHPDHPDLYRLRSRVYQGGRLLDETITMIGIRRFSFLSPEGKADGFYSNGEKLYLRGANRHQAFPYVGDAASNSMQYRDALLLKRGGFNAVRAAHYPPSPAFLKACDEVGLLVIECQPGWQYYSEDPVFVEQTYRNIREMIRRDRNHPSIFLWETSLNESPTPSFWMEKAAQIAHEELSGNQLFTADDLNKRSRPFYDVFYKVINPDGSDPLPDKPSLTREWGDAWFADASRENGLRASRIYTEKGLINQCVLRQNALNGEKEEAHGGYWDHAGLDANPRISGYFLWSFNDYTRGYDPVTAFSGVVDLDRYPKFGYYQMQAMQDARNETYGPMVHIASYNNHQALDSTILVFSNCDTVRLYRNGKLMAEKSRKANASTAPFIATKGGSPYFSFELGSYRQGALRAEGVMNGKTVCTHRVETPGRPHHLEIVVADEGIAPTAGGTDMLPIYIKICDEKGNLVSDAKEVDRLPIKIKVKGAAKLIGGNSPWAAINPQFSEGGIAYALIRTVNQAGTFDISAECEDLLPAALKINTTAERTLSVPDGRHATWVNEYDLRHQPTANTALAGKAAAPIDLSDATIKVNSATDRAAVALLDGNLSSAWQAEQTPPPFSILIDFGKSQDLSAYRIYWGKDSDWYTYTLEVSVDATTWLPIENHHHSSGQDYKIKDLKQRSVRFVRLAIEDIRPENSKVTIREIEFFGDIE